MGTKMNLRIQSYAGKETIELLDNTKVVGGVGPMGVGQAPNDIREGAAAIAKYSAAAKALDDIIVNCRVNAICSEDTVYGECATENGIKRFLVTDGTKVDYEGEKLEGSLALLPFVLYALRNESDHQFMMETFEKVRKEYCEEPISDEDKGMLKNVLSFCDAFYYGYIKKQVEVDVNEHNLEMGTVKQAVKSGLLTKMTTLKNVKTPNMTGVNLGETEVKTGRLSDEELEVAIKEGKTVLPYEWDTKQKERIPSPLTLESFVPNKTYYNLVHKITNRLQGVMSRMESGLKGVEAIGKDYVNLFITGKPGTGKTTLAYALGAAIGMPVYTIALTKNTEEDVFQGMNKVVDGALKFVSTDFLDAYVNGGIIILEEINLPDPSVVMGSIGQAVEFPFTLMKDGYIPVKRHPMCVIIGTMNIGTFGSKGVNQALSSRFRQSYILNDPTEDDFINILMNTGARKKDAKWVYTAYTKITDYLKSPQVNADDVCLNVTLRGCIGALENIKEGEDAKDAIRNTLVGKISEVDLELAESVWKDVVQSLPELY